MLTAAGFISICFLINRVPINRIARPVFRTHFFCVNSHVVKVDSQMHANPNFYVIINSNLKIGKTTALEVIYLNLTAVCKRACFQ